MYDVYSKACFVFCAAFSELFVLLIVLPSPVRSVYILRLYALLYLFFIGLPQVCVGLCFDWTMRLLGPLLLLLATGLISGVVGMYFKYILPGAATVGSIPVRFRENKNGRQA